MKQEIKWKRRSFTKIEKMLRNRVYNCMEPKAFLRWFYFFFVWSISNVVDSTCFIHSVIWHLFFFRCCMHSSLVLKILLFQIAMFLVFVLVLHTVATMYLSILICLSLNIIALRSSNESNFFLSVRVFCPCLYCATLASHFSSFLCRFCVCVCVRCFNVDYFKLSIKRTIQSIMYWYNSIFCDF